MILSILGYIYYNVYAYVCAFLLYSFLLRMVVFFFNTDLTDWTDECPVAIKEIKKFVAFPRLTPLQPDAYAHPRKRASLSDPPHPTGLPCWQTGKPQNKIAALGSTK